MPAVSDSHWSAQGITPGEIEAALRELLRERHAESESYVPARALNLVCIVDKAWSGEIANRLRGVGRYHASRTIVCEVEPGRDRLDAVATLATDVHPKTGELALLRETVIVDIGPMHLPHVDSIVDPLVISDLPTVVWAPHGHPEAVDGLLGLAQTVLVDSVDEDDLRAALQRASELLTRAYVVDLAWLRATPWRERVAALFDPPPRRAELDCIRTVTIHHHPASTAVALLLVGWLASRLGWQASRLAATDGALAGTARSGGADGSDVAVRIEAEPGLTVRGLAGLTIATATGHSLSLQRGAGGLRAREALASGEERTWTILGASRGEPGILGEGIRQALLRDPAYGPALHAACALAP